MEDVGLSQIPSQLCPPDPHGREVSQPRYSRRISPLGPLGQRVRGVGQRRAEGTARGWQGTGEGQAGMARGAGRLLGCPCRSLGASAGSSPCERGRGRWVRGAAGAAHAPRSHLPATAAHPHPAGPGRGRGGDGERGEPPGLLGCVSAPCRAAPRPPGRSPPGRLSLLAVAWPPSPPPLAILGGYQGQGREGLPGGKGC